MFTGNIFKIILILAGTIAVVLPSYIQKQAQGPESEILIENIAISNTTEEKIEITEIKDEEPIKPEAPKQKIVTKVEQKPVVNQTVPITSQVVISQTSKYANFEEINIFVRKSIVNIFCTTKTAGTLYPVTGTGIIISGSGVILTNAHIGQYFLLKDFDNQKDFMECIIRTGNPAYPTYKAELLYISPTWVQNNKDLLTTQNPQGTGEHDYALLRITNKIDESNVGLTPYLPINLDENNKTGNSVLLASYPAGFLSGQIIAKELYQSSSIATISKIYTFGTNTIDLISVGGTVVSQKGSSGGAVVDTFGELIGLISTSSEGDQTSERDLRAITLSYIERDLKEESGSSLVDVLSYPTEYAKNFNENIAPKLTEILTNAILKK